jgi:hypothetical protein
MYTVSGVSDGARIPAGAPTDGFNWIFARHGVFIHIPAPDGTVWWSAQVSDRAGGESGGPADPTAIGPSELAGIFATEPGALDVLGAATQVRSATLMHVLAPVRVRHDDRTVLVGDAAHPAGSGQGASMALEDAVVLTRELAAAGGIADGLAAFDRARQPRAGKLARMESKNRDAKTAGPLAARLREIVMPHVFPRVYENATGWLYDFEAVELPAPRRPLEPEPLGGVGSTETSGICPSPAVGLRCRPARRALRGGSRSRARGPGRVDRSAGAGTPRAGVRAAAARPRGSAASRNSVVATHRSRTASRQVASSSACSWASGESRAPVRCRRRSSSTPTGDSSGTARPGPRRRARPAAAAARRTRSPGSRAAATSARTRRSR